MKVYFNEQRWKEKLEAIPKALRNKKLAELDKVYEERGIRCNGWKRDTDGSAYAEVEIRRGTPQQNIYAFMEDMSVSCVTVEPSDVAPLYGEDVVSLGMRHSLSDRQNVEALGLDRVEPDAFFDALKEARFRSSVPTSSEESEAVLNDEDGMSVVTQMELVNAGYLDANDTLASQEWEEPKPELTDAPPLEGEWLPDPDEDDGWSAR